MYCKKCGKEIDSDDRFCRNCGTPVTHNEESRNDAEDKERPKKYKIDTSEFVWNVHDFNREPHKTENVEVDWKKGTVKEVGDSAGIHFKTPGTVRPVSRPDAAKTDRARAYTRSDEEVPEKKETEAEIKERSAEAGFRNALHAQELKAMGKDETSAPHNGDMKEHMDASGTKRARDTEKIERFYTLNRKNEEFQKLLDKEYERIRAGREGSYIMTGIIPETKEDPYEDIIKHDIDTFPSQEEREKGPDGAVFVAEYDEKSNTPDRILQEEITSDDAGYEKKKEIQETPYEDMKIFDTLELEKDLMGDKCEEKCRDHSDLMDEISERIANTRFSVERTYASLLDDIFGEINSEKAASAMQRSCLQEGAPDEQSSKPAEEDSCATKGTYITLTAENDTYTEEGPEPSEPVQEGKLGKEQEENGRPEQLPPLFFTEDDEDDDEDDDEEDDKKESHVLGVLAVILTIILVFGCAVFGIKFFAPESKAGIFINDRINSIVAFIQHERYSRDDEDKNADTETSDDTAVEEDGSTDVRTADDIIASLGDINKNIAKIVSDPDLKYDPGHNYENASVSAAIPLDDETGAAVFTGPDGNLISAGEAVIKTLTAFDSGWIDYVNTGNAAVFDILKKGSNADNNCRAFVRNGVTKTFDLLKIGEIRKDANGYYVWAKELISTTSGGNSTTDEFNWIYYMEPVEGRLLIVDYYK